MAASSSFFLWVSFISLLLCCCSYKAFPVPVFIWSKDSELSSSTPVLAGHTLKEWDFREKYLNKLFQTPQVVSVFLQDRLSIDDITHYGDAYSAGNHGAAFSNLKAAMETANSSAVLPSVELSSSGGNSDELVYLIRKMATGNVQEFTQEEAGNFNIGEFSLDHEKTNVFIFHLRPASLSAPEEIFALNDKLIGSVTKQLSSSGLPYSCILTAAAPSQAVQERQLLEERSTIAHDRLRRAVESVTYESSKLVNRSLFVNADCILLYSKGLTFKHANGTYDIFNMTNQYTASSNCKEKNSTDSIEVKFIMDNATFDLSFTFLTNGSSGQWACSDATLDVNGKFDGDDVKETLSFNCSDILMGPTIYSYSCVNVTLSSGTSSLIFSQFQVQPFNVKNGTFAYAYDCTGFFTIPIFMGLIVVGVLLIILFVGILAMFSLTTMDRFDDPKGPTIHVPTG
ncbi:unnamed protein product [Porites lobata]|uniref:V-type proton ATPase subunit S1-like n=1 Tax=Porites lobata TaxID=104759 RepID=A0ABN8N298_9CNID|nr:unnamed protein product [Porites lobata]